MLNRTLAKTNHCGCWLLLLLCLLCLQTAAQAAALKVALLGPSAAQQALQQGWQGAAPVWVDASDAEVLITLGEAAFKAAAKWRKPRLALNVPVAQVQQARSQHCHCSSVALHPDPRWQLQLIRELFTGRQRVALVYAAEDRQQATRLTRKLPSGLTLQSYPLADMTALNARLSSILENNDILLLLPSRRLFNADSARFILLSSYRLGRPVIGPDAAFVKAGSLASTYANNSAVLQAIQKQLQHYAAKRTWLAPVYPQPDIIVNDHVAHSFDMQVKPSSRLLQRLGVSHDTQ